MFDNFGFMGSKLLKEAEEERRSLAHPYVGSEHLLLAILKSDTFLTERLADEGLTYKKFRKELIEVVGIPKKNTEINLYTPLLKRIIANALNDARENNGGIVTNSHFMIAMLDEGEGIAIRIMIGMNINLDDLYDELKIRPQDIKSENLEVFNIGRVLNEQVDSFDKVIGREKELNEVIEILLRKKKSNPLLIGEAGVGKTAIVEELARRIEAGKVPYLLRKKRVVELSMGNLVSGTKYRGEFEERLTKIIKEVIHNKDIILFIDEVHSMVNAGGAEGAINASDILKPYLARGDLKIIGATTTDEYEKYIAKDKALERRFETVLVKETSLQETEKILKGLKTAYEAHHKIQISPKNITDLLTLANRYLTKKRNPDKTIDLLDSVCAYVKRKNLAVENLTQKEEILKDLTKQKEAYVKSNAFDKALTTCLKISEVEAEIKILKEEKNDYITKEDIIKVIEAKSNIPVIIDKRKLMQKLEAELTKHIIYEEKALEKLLENVRIFYQEEGKIKLLLNGPSGVGKTSCVKLISQITGTNLIRLDMSEYKDATSISKLIGTHGGLVGYSDTFVLRKVKYNPYSLILVDELEKAHPSIINLFLQIMDEGIIHDAHGEAIDFTHTLIIMTSNAYNKPQVGFGNLSNTDLTEYFSEEFLGRFDDIITFKPLNKKDAITYLKTKLKEDIDYDCIVEDSSLSKYGFRYLNKIIAKQKLKLEA